MVEKNTSTEELLELLKKKRSFDEYLKETPEFITGDLSAYLEQMLVEKGRKKADVIRGSQLDRNYAYQIFSGTRKPTRDKLLALGFGMGLTIEEMQKVLKTSEYPVLYVKNKRDSIILFGLDKQISVGEMNELLYEMEEDIIE
ncbi:hypothetical protein CE91St62_16850 [Lachnospiraceae bacterium]|uniref:hypothetical protein n=1 Tax=Extibacter sp. GGCC_0201 TaxID=2731209 RepID=UPI001AA10C7D|nr:hypothetical protein [Extibacter sp. GGCC_0201]MBO1721471.1 hypothetical protein [Extibacter sp. GGCC_0201]BDF33620.1 hypothetical protein CE91St61_16950 [Lachnospiraceae bacterium]BDF37624.1 hypothetical protein CE91St62_16850 [Lachnospiraceae bacterium]